MNRCCHNQEEDMGRKSSAKANKEASTPPPDQPRSKTPLMAITLVIVALVAGGLALWSDSTPTEAEQAAAQFPDRGPIPADLKPHTQANLPPLNFPAYPMARSQEVVRAAYTFAAEHPEVLSYVPCFCGCERAGHRGNEDCFVKARDANGDVVDWDEHGMECAVCIDVATRSRQMFTSGATVADIRAAIDKEFGPLSTTRTPTPAVPHNH
jgi:Protein of unknown function with PCYCGC motif